MGTKRQFALREGEVMGWGDGSLDNAGIDKLIGENTGNVSGSVMP